MSDYPEGYNSPPDDGRFDNMHWIFQTLLVIGGFIFMLTLIPVILLATVWIAIVNIFEWIWDATASKKLNSSGRLLP